MPCCVHDAREALQDSWIDRLDSALITELAKRICFVHKHTSRAWAQAIRVWHCSVQQVTKLSTGLPWIGSQKHPERCRTAIVKLQTAFSPNSLTRLECAIWARSATRHTWQQHQLANPTVQFIHRLQSSTKSPMAQHLCNRITTAWHSSASSPSLV